MDYNQLNIPYSGWDARRRTCDFIFFVRANEPE
jgi:hypothetical protein